MSRADLLYRETCARILREGVWDTDQSVRPRWADGSPAHTVKCFGVVNRYDLTFVEGAGGITTPLYGDKTFTDFMKDIKLPAIVVADGRLGSINRAILTCEYAKMHIWDSWADESGSIGKAYGYQLGIKYRFPEGEFDQVDRVLYDLKHNPASRRILTSLYNFADLHEMALYPCAYSMTFHVSGNRLNAILNQRSQDMLTANNWNVVQYAVLVHMLAQVSGLVAGELVHVIADCHIYDRHIPLVEQMLELEPYPAPEFRLDPAVTDFYAFTPDSVRVENYCYHPFSARIPVAI